MRLIPVIDLLKGQAVHAVRGERNNYQPVKSVLTDTADPADLARAYRERLGLDELYIADLDAIQGFSGTANRDFISSLARSRQTRVILDSGITDARAARRWLDAGISKAVIGSETLLAVSALKEIPGMIDRDRLIFSLDMRAGKTVSDCPALSAMSPIEALQELHSAGWQEVLLLDLDRVGTGGGIGMPLLVEARSQFPGLSLLAGGGIAGPEQLFELKSLGFAGVLVATVLHNGTIDARQLSNFE